MQYFVKTGHGSGAYSPYLEWNCFYDNRAEVMVISGELFS
jgi:hypothetical protein